MTSLVGHVPVFSDLNQLSHADNTVTLLTRHILTQIQGVPQMLGQVSGPSSPHKDKGSGGRRFRVSYVASSFTDLGH